MGLSDVRREAVPPEEANQDIHLVLQPVGVSGANHSIICVKDSQATPEKLSHPIVDHPLIFHCHVQPHLNEIFRNDFGRVPAQDGLFALILWYVAKSIFIS